MESIEKLFEEDEKVLWKHEEVRNLIAIHDKLILILIIGIVITTVISTPIFLYELNFIPFILAGVSLFGLNAVLIGIILLLIKDYKRKKKVLKMSKLELQKYDDVHLMTNKAWYQKNYDYNVLIEPTLLDREDIECFGDVIRVERSAMKYISVNKSGMSYKVKFHVEEEFDVWNDAIGIVLLDEETIQILMDLLNSEFNLKREGLFKSRIQIFSVE